MTTLRPLRVAIVNDALTVGGAERVAVDIANSLHRRGHEAVFCATRCGGPLADELNDSVGLHVLNRSATWDPAGLQRFVDIVRSNRIDIVHSHGRGTMKLVALALASSMIDVRHVAHDHFGWLHLDRGVSRGLRWSLRRHTDAYLGVDSRLCRWATDTVGVDPRRVVLQRSGLDISRFDNLTAADPRQMFGLERHHFVLAMIANFRPQKDHPTLFRAIATLPADDLARTKLVICGSTTSDVNYYDRCMAMARELGVDRNIVVAGPRADAVAIVAGSDAAVLSSKNETGPLVVLEYMAAGRPFVATNTGEITAAVRDLDVGLVPAPRDHDEVAAALHRLMTMSEADRQDMGRRGAAAVRDLFSQDAAIEGIERVYRRVMSGAFPALANPGLPVPPGRTTEAAGGRG